MTLPAKIPARDLTKEDALRCIVTHCSDWPVDEIDEVMLFLLDSGFEEGLAESVVVELFAA